MSLIYSESFKLKSAPFFTCRSLLLFQEFLNAPRTPTPTSSYLEFYYRSVVLSFCCVLGQDTSSPSVRPGFSKCAKNTRSGQRNDTNQTESHSDRVEHSAFITGASYLNNNSTKPSNIRSLLTLIIFKAKCKEDLQFSIKQGNKEKYSKPN